MANPLPRKQTITVDSTMAARQVNVKIIQGARKRLCQENDALSSSDEEMSRFAVDGITDEELLQKELQKRLGTYERKQEKTLQANKRFEEISKRKNEIARKMEEARDKRLDELRFKEKASDPLPAVPYWPEVKLESVNEPRVLRCPHFPKSKDRSLLASTVLKLALGMDAGFLWQHDGVTAQGAQVREIVGGFHCVVSQKLGVGIDVVGEKAYICEDTQH